MKVEQCCSKVCVQSVPIVMHGMCHTLLWEQDISCRVTKKNPYVETPNIKLRGVVTKFPD